MLHLSWALDQETDQPLDKLLLIVLANSCQEDGTVDLLDAHKACGVSVAEAHAALERLAVRVLVAWRHGELRLAAPQTPGTPNNDPPQWLRRELLDEAGHRCVACGSTEKLCIDHIIPKRRGGTGDRANLQVLCQPCNTSKGNKRPEDWKGRKA